LDAASSSGDGDASQGDWLAELEPSLQRAEAIKDALEDVHAIVGSAAVAWLEPDESGVSATVGVWVLSGTTLHRVEGARDQPAPTDLNRLVQTDCSYFACPITRSASFELALTRSVRHDDVSSVTRTWTFNGCSPRPFDVTYSSSTDHSRSERREPVPFGRALAQTIARVNDLDERDRS
jgi:hypothetical protein